MVLMTLTLFIYILAAMSLDASKISGDFMSVSLLNDFYAEQDGYENILYFRLVEISLDSYYETLNESAPKIGDAGNSDLNEIFKNKVQLNFKSPIEASDKIKDLNNGVNTFTFDGRKVSISNSLKEIEKNMSFDLNDNSKIFYLSLLNISFDLKSVDLPTFNEILEAYKFCNSSANFDNIEVCLNMKLPVFTSNIKCVAIDQFGAQIPYPLRIVTMPNGNLFGDKKCIIKLTSKDNYYINKEMKKIEFYLNFDFLLNPLIS